MLFNVSSRLLSQRNSCPRSDWIPPCFLRRPRPNPSWVVCICGGGTSFQYRKHFRQRTQHCYSTKQSQFTMCQRGARLHTRGVVITRYRVVQKTNLKNTKTKRPRNFSRNARRWRCVPQRAAANRPGHRPPARRVRRSPGVGGHARYHVSLSLCLSTSRGWSNCVGNHDVDYQRDNQNSQVTATFPLLSAVWPRKHAYIICFLTRLVSSFNSPHASVIRFVIIRPCSCVFEPLRDHA